MELNRTDLAIETRESFPEDNVEIEGVVLNDKLLQKGRIRVSTVNILNEKGAELMGKPAGNYVTIEFTDKSMYMDDKDTKKFEDKVIKEICDIITDMTNSSRKTDTEPEVWAYPPASRTVLQTGHK